MSGPPHPLHGNQMKAVQPDDTVWLSASAGTGKTQVLSSRVLRLLLAGVKPGEILCLTFTKAGATEMAARINEKLASWVRLDEIGLTQELKAIGADFGPDTRGHARTLFTAVLDCPGGGLRIDTIHAFAQWLLAAFPHEAGLVPGTRAMEDRDRILLLRQVLSDLLVKAEHDPLGDPQLLSALADLSLRMGPEEVEGFLLRCAEAREAWFGPGGWQEPMRANVLRLLELPADADETMLAKLCGDDVFAVGSLRRCLRTLAGWDTATGREGAAAIEAWLTGDPSARAAGIAALYGGLFTKSSGAPKQLNNVLKRDPDYGEHADRVAASIAAVREMGCLLALADRLVPALRLGRAFALAWDEAKQREGLIDFDDQIRQAAALLNTSALADWIRYKLDRRFDHILVDEAQDTNAAQWRIIDALTGDFFTGAGKYGGQPGDAMRTLFVVGDYKQAIFRFQGTSPENFEKARQRVRDALFGAVDNASREPGWNKPRPLMEYGLDRSFRTAQTVLDFVDQAIAGIGHANFGLADPPERHVGETRPGYVALWRPIGGPSEDEEDEEGDAPNWFSRSDRQLAERIAQQVKRWTDPAGEGFVLNKGGVRRAGPGDVMILVRKRRELAGLIVARLHAAGVPVAGVDRLRLGAPLAVRDLIAALRFAAQPLDDLSLAALLVSPLIGWTQEQLLAHGYREKRVRLWDHLRAARHPEIGAAVERLRDLLERADYDPPQVLLHWLLVGPWWGRRKLVARLGREANDPIDELLNAASAYAVTGTPSLAGFLHWFDAGEGELKREAGSSAGLVRVMTVHGAKGLQAPIVILADATGDPAASRSARLAMPDPAAPDERAIPLPGLTKDERAGCIAKEHARVEKAEQEEHWRLLYVAMTRAEEALFIGGALGAREKEPAANSWYAKLEALFVADDWADDTIWGGRYEWGQRPLSAPGKSLPAELPLPEPLPRWLTGEAPAEPRPPKPLAPSGLGEDLSADPPYPPGANATAAKRGILVHKLLERLPEVAAVDRYPTAHHWLSRQAPELDPDARDQLVRSALDVLSNEAWRDLFAPGSLAEVPIAAVVGERVVAGTIDRLVVGSDRIRLVDYKTARRPPEDIGEVPVGILRQMAAYAAALESAYPGRSVEAALLYTAAPRLIAIPGEVLAEHKQTLLVGH